ncbi:hypothetical protein CC1G_11017 [Coprinopsis cinerea okayama7|uniref:Uncharacterized protein n=1 Tax=Coprinopsis cinerea (strain Okayama-7 / 130 / ATCC MYA-4618 / FGSC 9003) TaxID=240176 RepID=A8NIQ5_COPC7|nr:hypothetical protein CC1G_11017 [Coprinopsis cinerea okayama7\|eukprot:XP_001834047.1 hypothetical protein CC1G_11017 [Coprinopsis cinerea okayama7\
MRHLVSSDNEKAAVHAKELTAYLFKRHLTKLKNRFEKGRDQCAKFFELARQPESWSSYTPREQKYLSAAQKIFEMTADFLAQSRLDQQSCFALHCRLLEARHSYIANEVPDALSMEFDLARYINKLLAPSFHILQLYKTAASLRRILHLALDAIHVPANTPPMNLLYPPSDDQIRAFFAGCYYEKSSESSEDGTDDIVAEVLQDAFDKVRSQLSKSTHLNPTLPHCESTLVRHLLATGSTAYPYIAVSKLSCLICGLYLSAWRKYCEEMKRRPSADVILTSLVEYRTRGCNGIVVPLLTLPSMRNDALDILITKHVIKTVKAIVNAILKTSVDNEMMRRSSQSIAGPGRDSPEPDWHTIPCEVSSILVSQV